VNKGENLIFIKGAIPGRKGTLVEIKGVWFYIFYILN
jgi:ribosomal protein L3